MMGCLGSQRFVRVRSREVVGGGIGVGPCLLVANRFAVVPATVSTVSEAVTATIAVVRYMSSPIRFVVVGTVGALGMVEHGPAVVIVFLLRFRQTTSAGIRKRGFGVLAQYLHASISPMPSRGRPESGLKVYDTPAYSIRFGQVGIGLTYSNGGFRNASIDQVLSKAGEFVSNGEQCFILDIRDNGEV